MYSKLSLSAVLCWTFLASSMDSPFIKHTECAESLRQMAKSWYQWLTPEKMDMPLQNLINAINKDKKIIKSSSGANVWCPTVYTEARIMRSRMEGADLTRTRTQLSPTVWARVHTYSLLTHSVADLIQKMSAIDKAQYMYELHSKPKKLNLDTAHALTLLGNPARLNEVRSILINDRHIPKDLSALILDYSNSHTLTPTNTDAPTNDH